MIGIEGGSCLGCGSHSRALRGILDLRTADDVYMPNAADWEFALRLNEDYDRLDFRGLLERYYDLSPEIPADLRRRQIGHILTARERAHRWLDALQSGPLGGTLIRGPILDLGCGTGSFLSAALRRDRDRGLGRQFGGIDIALRWLLVARKRLDEEGFSQVRLVCGCAERLPFRDQSHHGIVAGDVIEHVGDQTATLAEAYRVLGPGGRLFLASPNRFSLAPEPHVQVWGVGFLPRRWMPSYVRITRKMDFSSIKTLGCGEWKRLLERSPFGRGWVYAPTLPESDRALFGPVKRAVAECYNAAVRTPLGQRAALAVGPLFHICCVRSPDGSGAVSHPSHSPTLHADSSASVIGRLSRNRPR